MFLTSQGLAGSHATSCFQDLARLVAEGIIALEEAYGRQVYLSTVAPMNQPEPSEPDIFERLGIDEKIRELLRRHAARCGESPEACLQRLIIGLEN